MLISRSSVAGCKWNPVEEAHVPLYITLREVEKSDCFRRPSFLCFLSVPFLFFFNCLQLKSWTWPLSVSAQPHWQRKTTDVAERITEQRAQPTALRSMTDLLLLVWAKTQSSLSSRTVCMIHSPHAHIRPEFCYMTLCSNTQVTCMQLLAPEQVHSSKFK